MSNIETLRSPNPQTPNEPSGSNGNLTNYRLTELERRTSEIEKDIKSINDLCIEINTKLNNFASKALLWQIFVGVLTASVITFIGHIVLRTLGS
ncbi:MAG: hypothetical protein OXG24_03595 [Gammaproteobacteria bacterium]|nr:hypothetical protein [Gammaproteobacteria bacterium]